MLVQSLVSQVFRHPHPKHQQQQWPQRTQATSHANPPPFPTTHLPSQAPPCPPHLPLHPLPLPQSLPVDVRHHPRTSIQHPQAALVPRSAWCGHWRQLREYGLGGGRRVTRRYCRVLARALHVGHRDLQIVRKTEKMKNKSPRREVRPELQCPSRVSSLLSRRRPEVDVWDAKLRLERKWYLNKRWEFNVRRMAYSTLPSYDL